MKGQSGYAILAPVTARFASSNPADPDSWRRLARGEKPGFGEAVRSKLVGLKPAYVWDISQTDGEPIPETPRPTLLQGQAPEGLWDGLADQITAHGFELRLVSNAKSIGGANGLTDYMTREVSVRMDMDDAAQVKTLAHELGPRHAPRPRQRRRRHAPRHRRGRSRVASPSWSAPHTGWRPTTTRSRTSPRGHRSVPGKTPVEVVQSTAERVRGAAVTILDKLDTPQVGDGNPPGLDREALAAGRGAAPVQTVAQRQVEPIGL